MELYASCLEALQLGSCACRHHRRNSNILHCCSLGLHEDTDHGGRHRRVSCLQHRRRLQFGACRLLSLLFLSSLRVSPICVSSSTLLCVGSPSTFLPIQDEGKRDGARKAAQQQGPRGFIKQQDCHGSMRRPCACIITARCYAELPAVHSGNH